MTPIPVPAAVTARGLFDYRYAFDLDDTELRAGPILDCVAGSSPFAAQACARDAAVTSIDPVGLEYWILNLTCGFVGVRVGSCGDLVFTGEPAKDGSAANLMVGEVDRLWGLVFRLGPVRVALVPGVAARC
jgi:hypothetical protein